MVNYKNFVLNEGELKSTPEVVEMSKPTYIYDFEKIVNDWCYKLNEYNCRADRMIGINSAGGQEIVYPHTPEEYSALCRERQHHLDNPLLSNYAMEMEMTKDHGLPKIFWKSKAITNFMGVIPFIPSVMINISPDWESVNKRTDTCKIKILTGIIEGYLAEGNRYSKASYVIENGSKGDFIHAHIVAEMNSNLIKSVNTHLAKGNHTKQLIKQADKLKGMEGMLKGVGIQKVFLRTEKLVQDKLDYLIEEKKPEGHKNHSVIFQKKDLVF